MIYYSHSAQAFFDDQIHSAAQIPEDAQAIDAQQHQALLDALNTGAHIADDLTVIPRPSPAHTWDGKAWALDKALQAE